MKTLTSLLSKFIAALALCMKLILCIMATHSIYLRKPIIATPNGNRSHGSSGSSSSMHIEQCILFILVVYLFFFITRLFLFVAITLLYCVCTYNILCCSVFFANKSFLRTCSSGLAATVCCCVFFLSAFSMKFSHIG